MPSLRDQADWTPETYADLRAQGEAFERLVVARLAQEWGMTLRRALTYEDQRVFGDTGILEIKLDRRLAETGNLCIETHERASRPGVAGSGDLIPSGILAESRAFLYGIGDEREFYVFSRRTLIEVGSSVGSLRHYETATSRGFLIPRYRAESYAEAVYDWTGAGT